MSGPRCARCQSPLADGDLRCAVCGLRAPELARAPEQEAAHVLRCQGCGAAVRYVAEAGAPKCAFCGAVTKVEVPTDPVEQAEHLVPFTVDGDLAKRALRAHLKSLGFFRPSDLASAASVEALRPLHWAAWIVEARALLSWTADSDAGSRRSSWAPHAGQTSLAFERLLVPASRGLRESECTRLAHAFDLGTARPVSATETNDGTLEHFDAQRSAARRIVVDAIQRTAEARLTQGEIPGSRFRNVHAAVLLEALTTHRVALPTYVLAYRYRGRVFRAIVHGQDARCVFGDAPYSIARIALVVVGAIALVAIVVALLSMR